MLREKMLADVEPRYALKYRPSKHSTKLSQEQKQAIDEREAMKRSLIEERDGRTDEDELDEALADFNDLFFS
jgi:hypothetical protein